MSSVETLESRVFEALGITVDEKRDCFRDEDSGMICTWVKRPTDTLPPTRISAAMWTLDDQSALAIAEILKTLVVACQSVAVSVDACIELGTVCTAVFRLSSDKASDSFDLAVAQCERRFKGMRNLESWH